MIKIRTQNFHCLRTINFKRKTIRNDYFVVDPEQRSKGIGTLVLHTQVTSSRHEGFENITLEAVGTPKYRETFNGYYTWASLGFSMNDVDHERFINILNDKKIEGINDIQSLMENSDLKYSWKNEWGFEWEGYFNLEADSKNSKYLNKYIENNPPKQNL